MAGGAQGGGSAAQSNPQQFQNALQNYRQGAAGMPSQVAGANMAAPGGAQVPELNPQTTSDIEKLLQYYKNQQISGNSAAPAAAPGGTTPGMYAGGPVGYANGGPMQANAFNAGMARQAPMPNMSQAPIAPQPAMQAPLANQQAALNSGMAQQAPIGQAPIAPQPAMQANMFNQQAALNSGMANQRAMPNMGQAPIAPPRTGGVTPMAPQTGGVMPMAPQPAPVPVNPQAALRAQAPVPMAQDPRFQQNPSMTPRMVAPPPAMPQRPQIQGNPNAMPMQRQAPRGRR